MRTVDIVSAIVMLALSAAVFFGTLGLDYWAEFAPGSAFAPVWVAVAGAVLGALLLVSALKRTDDEPHGFPDRTGMFRVVSVAAALWAFVVVVPLLGFIGTGALFSLLLLLVIERRPLVPSLLTTAVVIGLVYGVFVAWLGISLPQGVLGV